MPLVYRVAKKVHPIYDATGAALVGARWTSPRIGVIYTASGYALAVLEKLVHANRTKLPGAHHALPILIPDSMRIERFDPRANPGWDDDTLLVARAYGDGWFRAARSPVLCVPSRPGQPVEWNYIINPTHPEAAAVQPVHASAFDVVWDGRLFGPAAGTVTIP